MVQLLSHVVPDKRRANKSIPFEIIWVLSIAAKMKQKMSVSDIPFAITDSETLSELGYSIWDSERSIAQGLMDESAVRNLIGQYEKAELMDGYNVCVQQHILTKMAIKAYIHLVDCTVLEVPLNNGNYEESSVMTKDGSTSRGYKLATLRGVVGDGGIIEETRLGTMKEHDLSLCRDMVLSSAMLKEGDILINDRGFISRELLNELKTRRQVDTYIPLRNNMDAHDQAVAIAKAEGVFHKHPNKKRKSQKIAFAQGVGDMWRSEDPQNDVPLNACVVWETKDDTYTVFVTTDTEKSAKQIIQTYELRPEIEEDYRQLKDFWKLDHFTSTKITMIAFHIVCTLLGYLLFQLYVATESGQQWAGRSLPVIAKNFKSEQPKTIIIYTGQYFAVFVFLEFIQLYASLAPDVRMELDEVLSTV